MALGVSLEGFSPAEEKAMGLAMKALQEVGYDTNIIKVIARAELPIGMRGMTYSADTIILSKEAFASQAMLNYVLEEEFLHLTQKLRGEAQSFGPDTARQLEESIDAIRKFRLPEQ